MTYEPPVIVIEAGRWRGHWYAREQCGRPVIGRGRTLALALADLSRLTGREYVCEAGGAPR